MKSPFEGNETAWMTVSEDKKTALVFWYRERNVVNADFTRVRLQGLIRILSTEMSIMEQKTTGMS